MQVGGNAYPFKLCGFLLEWARPLVFESERTYPSGIMDTFSINMPSIACHYELQECFKECIIFMFSLCLYV